MPEKVFNKLRKSFLKKMNRNKEEESASPNQFKSGKYYSTVSFLKPTQEYLVSIDKSVKIQ